MALSETDTSDCNSDSSIDGSKQERKEKFLTKVVVRRLPPSMNKELFLNQVSPLPDYDYMYFVRADMSLGEFAFARAYINFKNSADIFIFKEKFDNYVFLDSKGNEYVAVVEFAPFSRIPKKRNKTRNDPKIGTIESDPLYMSFVESLNQVSNESEEKPEYCFQPTLEEDKKIINTPLLDFIKQRRIDRQKIKEEKREERKRRELERKRIKEDERKGRKRIEHVSSISKITTKTSNSPLEIIDENKSESGLKSKEKKLDDYRYKSGKSGVKEYIEKRTYKDLHRIGERKSPTKIRQRNQNIIEREPRRTEYKSKRDDGKDDTLRNKKDEDRNVEKKVKKYSERREERKNEIKKQEPRIDNEEIDKNKDENKSEENNANREKDDSKSNNDIERSCEKENSKRDDPRTQRRIRNKDRPTMAIYQPGMGLNRNKKSTTDETDEEQKNSNNFEMNKSE